jgi:hypothetical protein
VLSFHFRSETAAQVTEAATPVLFRFCALIKGGLPFLLTAFNGRINFFQHLHAGRVHVSGRSKCTQLVGDALAALYGLLSGYILQGGNDCFIFRI